MEKLLKEKNTFSLNTYTGAIELLHDDRMFLIKNVYKIEETFNPHISSFTGLINDKQCSFIVNCGHTPPTIKLEFATSQEVLFINHSFQEKILEELSKLVEVPSHS